MTQGSSTTPSSGVPSFPNSPLQLEPLEAALRRRGLCVHYTTWLRLIRAKGLPATKVGGRYYVDPTDLDLWLQSQRVSPKSPEPRAVRGAMQPAAAEAVLAHRRRGGASRSTGSGGGQ